MKIEAKFTLILLTFLSAFSILSAVPSALASPTVTYEKVSTPVSVFPSTFGHVNVNCTNGDFATGGGVITQTTPTGVSLYVANAYPITMGPHRPVGM